MSASLAPRPNNPAPTFKDFYGRNFLVTRDTLIPRPETEGVIDAALTLCGKAYLPGIKPPAAKITDPVILDVGTGTGCLAITLKKELPKSQITALDISEKALEVAQKNAENLRAKINFKKSDLLESYIGETPNLIVANLPYVDKNWDWLDKDALKKEPELALYAENGGLAIIFQLLDQLKDKPWQNYYLVLESDPCQQKRLVSYATRCGLSLLKASDFITVFKH